MDVVQWIMRNVNTAAQGIMGNPSELARSESWSRYWQMGALHSCGGSFSGNYAGELRAFWLSVFDGLPNNPRVLDVCCGNAPLSLLLLDERRERLGNGQIDAVDLADISPPWLSNRSPEDAQRVRVHPRTNAQALPFGDASVDLCMSQYGIEYIGEPALLEILRVLRPGGRLAAVVHHADGLPVKIARAEVEHVDWAMGAVNLFAVTEAMLEPMARSATLQGQASLRDDFAANHQRAAFNTALTQLGERIETSPYVDVLAELRDGLMAAVQQARAEGVEASARALSLLRVQLTESKLRQAELVAFALDRSQLLGWAQLSGDGEATIRELRFDQGDLAGWAVALRAGAAG